MIMQNINSYNLCNFEFILLVSFREKNLKMKKMSVECATIIGVKFTSSFQNSL